MSFAGFIVAKRFEPVSKRAIEIIARQERALDLRGRLHFAADLLQLRAPLVPFKLGDEAQIARAGKIHRAQRQRWIGRVDQPARMTEGQE